MLPSLQSNTAALLPTLTSFPTLTYLSTTLLLHMRSMMNLILQNLLQKLAAAAAAAAG
jgi:hypothetical protein